MVEIGLFISATWFTTYLTSITFTEIVKKLFYDIHETPTDMYAWNACMIVLFVVTMVTQLKCFKMRMNFHELQKFYANCLARIMKEKPTLSQNIKNGLLVLKQFLFPRKTVVNVFSRIWL